MSDGEKEPYFNSNEAFYSKVSLCRDAVQGLIDAENTSRKDAPNRLYTAAEVIRLANISRTTFDRRVAKGEIPSQGKIGRSGKKGYSLELINELRKEYNTFNHRNPRHEKLPIVCVENQKGGAGKTTTVVSLAGKLGEEGRRVLIIDLDPQGTTTTMTLQLNPNHQFSREETVVSFVTGESDTIADKIVETSIPQVDIIPANHSLYSLELGTAYRLVNLEDPDQKLDYITRLKRGIQSVGDSYDVVIIDTPPSLGITSIIAWYTANAFILPLKPALGDLESSVTFLETMADYEQDFGLIPQHEFRAFLVTDYEDPGVDGKGNKKQSSQRVVYDTVQAVFQENAIKNPVPRRAAFHDLSIQLRTPYDARDPKFKKLRDDIEPALSEIISRIDSVMDSKE